MIQGLKVDGDSSRILSITLQDVLACIDNPEPVHWALLWFDAFGSLEPEGVVAFGERVNDSPAGIMSDWASLLALNQVDQIIDVIIIGNSNPADLHRYKTDEEMYEACDYCLELVDSSYWLLHSKNLGFIEQAKLRLPGVNNIK